MEFNWLITSCITITNRTEQRTYHFYAYPGRDSGIQLLLSMFYNNVALIISDNFQKRVSRFIIVRFETGLESIVEVHL